MSLVAACSSAAPTAPPTPSPAGVVSAPSASPGGTTWQVDADTSAFDGGTPYDATAFGPGFVAVGETDESGNHSVASTWTSPDGHTWTRTTDSPANTDHVLYRVLPYGGKLIAVAYGCNAITGECGGGTIWSSADGTTWQPGAVLTQIRVNDIGTDGSRIVALLNQETNTTTAGEALVSTDGIKFTDSPSNALFGDATLGAVALDTDNAVMVGNNAGAPSIWTSKDGATWTKVGSGFGSGEMRNVAVAGPATVVVGRDSSGAVSWFSSDGATWQRSAAQDSLKDGVMDAVAAVGQMFVAVGKNDDGAAVWTSSDGLTWTKQRISAPLPGAELTTVALGPNAVVAMGPAGSGHVAVVDGPATQ